LQHFVCWHTSAHLQLRLEAQVTILIGMDVAAIWEDVPAASRLSYGSTPAPGQPIAQALDYTKVSDAESFVVLRLQISTVDALHFGPNHRRAKFDRHNKWVGAWLAP
jgi:pyridoxamine 5'-phosphate oxidase